MTNFDANTSTPLLAEVREALIEALAEIGDPSCISPASCRAQGILEDAEQAVLNLFETAGEILFTSGPCESAWLALASAARCFSSPNIVLGTADSRDILDHTLFLKERGIDARFLPVDEQGLVIEEALDGLVDESTALVVLTLVNADTGVINDAGALAGRVKSLAPSLVLVDACQAVGRLDLRGISPSVDIVSVDSKTFHGPSGAAALWIREGAPFVPPYEPRHNIPAIAGMGAAAKQLVESNGWAQKLQGLRDILDEGMLALEGVQINCAGAPRVCNTSNYFIEGVEAEALAMLLAEQGIEVGSFNDSLAPSHVMHALGKQGRALYGNVRFSLHVQLSEPDIWKAVDASAETMAALSQLS